MLFQAAMKRWAISIRIHDAKTGLELMVKQILVMFLDNVGV
jgi:hypothetical protein